MSMITVREKQQKGMGLRLFRTQNQYGGLVLGELGKMGVARIGDDGSIHGFNHVRPEEYGVLTPVRIVSIVVEEV